MYVILKSTNMPQNFTVNLVFEAVFQGVPILLSHLAAVPMAIPPLKPVEYPVVVFCATLPAVEDPSLQPGSAVLLFSDID